MKIRDFGPKNFKCAVFDLDGTLLDSTGIWEKIDIEFLAKRNIEVPKDYIETIKTHNFKTGSVYTAERFDLKENPDDIAREWYAMASNAYANEIQLKAYAKEFLYALKDAGKKLCVATSSDRQLYESCLKRNGIYDVFDNFTQTDEVNRGKGYPDVYELAAARCGVLTSECIVFEDILKAVEGAVSGGFYTVAVEDAASIDDMKELKRISDLYVKSYAELLTFE